MNLHEAIAAFEADKPFLEARGISWAPGAEVKAYLPDAFRRDFTLAMDAQPSLVTDPNSAVPAMLTTLIDPQIYRVLFAPTKAAEIATEVRKGTWLDETTMFPVVEFTGEVSSYGDYAENGRAGANTNWPQRQSYLFQVIKEYGERELERAGLARINWISEVNMAAANILVRYQNLTYHYGVAGLQNYGLFNDPNLSAALTPAPKAAGGTAWVQNGAVVATANEIYNDIEALFIKLVNQNGGLVDRNTRMTLALSPASEAALTATNSFNVNVSDLLKKNFPNLRVVSDYLYGAQSSANPQGVVAGNLMQLIADEVEGQRTVFCAYNEKMRAHPIIRATSSFRQKETSGTWGAVFRYPAGLAQMVGI